MLIILLIGLTLVSWGAATERVSFPSRTYPTVNGSTFVFASSFNSPLLDYQWAFGGEGSYLVNQTGGYVQIAAVGSHDTAYLYRGWEQVIDGFHSSNATMVGLEFKFIGFAQNSSTMIISRMNGGWFGAQRMGSATDFVYFDDTNNKDYTLAPADNGWHSLNVSFTATHRFVQFENQTLSVDGGGFSRLFLGNPDLTPTVGGYVQFSNVTVTQTDFPSLESAWYAAPVTLLLPLAAVAAIFEMRWKRQVPLDQPKTGAA